MSFIHTLSRWLLVFLRFTVGCGAAFLAIGVTVSVIEALPSALSLDHWYLRLLFLFWAMVMGGLAASLAYGLFFMRYWVIPVIRVILGGLVLGFFVSLLIDVPESWREVVASRSWLVVNWLVLILAFLDALLRQNGRYLTRGSA